MGGAVHPAVAGLETKGTLGQRIDHLGSGGCAVCGLHTSLGFRCAEGIIQTGGHIEQIPHPHGTGVGELGGTVGIGAFHLHMGEGGDVIPHGIAHEEFAPLEQLHTGHNGDQFGGGVDVIEGIGAKGLPGSHVLESRRMAVDFLSFMIYDEVGGGHAFFFIEAVQIFGEEFEIHKCLLSGGGFGIIIPYFRMDVEGEWACSVKKKTKHACNTSSTARYSTAWKSARSPFPLWGRLTV